MTYSNKQRLYITIAIVFVAAVQTFRGAYESAMAFMIPAFLFGWSYWKTKQDASD
jgi:hypothetical protein